MSENKTIYVPISIHDELPYKEGIYDVIVDGEIQKGILRDRIFYTQWKDGRRDIIFNAFWLKPVSLEELMEECVISFMQTPDKTRGSAMKFVRQFIKDKNL